MDYQKVYNQIIERAKKECRKKNNGVYYEAHHIVPRCLGGTGSCKQWRTHPNIVLLTAREHFLCHWLLYELYPLNNSLAVAFSTMSLVENNQQFRYRPSSRIIEKAKLKLSEIKKSFRHTDESKRKISESSRIRKYSIETIQKRVSTRMANKGYGWSDETKKKQIEARTGKKHSEEHKRKLGNAALERWKTRGDELRKSYSLKMKGRFKPVVECPFCKTKGGKSAMIRWHFENCKLKLNNYE
jgi:hypothetical protein